MQTGDKRNIFSYTKDQFAPFGSFWGFVLESLKIVVISLAIILPIRYFLIQPFYVKGASMEPTFHTMDYLIVNELEYRLNDPQRGDIIIFRYPRDPKQFFIKRVIGLPGDRVVVRNHKVLVYNDNHKDGLELKEGYLSSDVITSINTDISLKEGEYVVFGDNREHSLDSRTFGKVPRSNIIGKVWFRGWPFSKMGVIEHYDYQGD